MDPFDDVNVRIFSVCVDKCGSAKNEAAASLCAEETNQNGVLIVYLKPKWSLPSNS